MDKNTYSVDTDGLIIIQEPPPPPPPVKKVPLDDLKKTLEDRTQETSDADRDVDNAQKVLDEKKVIAANLHGQVDNLTALIATLQPQVEAVIAKIMPELPKEEIIM